MRTERRVGAGALVTTLVVGLLLSGLAVPAHAQLQEQEPAAVLELSLQDAIELALRHNLLVRIASLNPDFAEESVRFQRGFFDPVFTFNLPGAFNRSSQAQASSLAGADILTSETINGGFSLQAQTGFGLAWSFGGNVQRFVTNSEFSTFNPQYSTSVQLQVRQSLLRNRGRIPNQQQLLVARNNHLVSEEQFRLQLQQQLFTVIQAYWTLASAHRSLEVAQSSLELAEEQLDRNNTMVRIGTLAAVDVLQTEQQVAGAEVGVIQAEINLRNQEDNLKQLLNLDAVVPEGWDVRLVPTEEPVETADPIDVDAAVAEALERDPQLIQNRLQVLSRQIELQAANNGLLPQVDFLGNVAVNGLGGDRIFRSALVDGGITEIQEGGVSESLRQLLSGDFRNWSLGIQVSFPVRNDQARAQYAQASIQERQAQMTVQNRELLVRLLVRQAARNVIGGAQAVEAAGEALDLADRQYTAELRRFQQGLSNTFQVLNFQRLLTGAQQSQLASEIAFNQAIASFQFVKGTLLEWLGIRIEDAGVGGPMMQARQVGMQADPAVEAAEAVGQELGSALERRRD